MSDRDLFAREDFRAALDEYDAMVRAHRDGDAPTPPDVNDFLAERGLAPTSGRKLSRENVIDCPPGYRPVPVGDQSGHAGGPPFCTCEPI